MKKYFGHWNFMRVLQLAVGVIVIVQSIQSKDWLFVAAGSVFVLMPVFNIGCCGTSCCSTLTISNGNRKTEYISYEETG